MRHFVTLLMFLLSTFAVEGNRHALQPYLVDSAHNTGIAIIICPGGSYSWLCMKNEGKEVALWLNENGINAFVLPYRVATVFAYIFGFRVLGLGNQYPDMLEDVENALSYLYANAGTLQIDTTKIGVIGFSAGGHLAMMSFLYNRTCYKPKFIGLLYPVVTMNGSVAHKRSRRGILGVWGQWNEKMCDSLSIENHVVSDCVPVFCANCKDDKVVNYKNSMLLDSALVANKVSHLYVQYQTGGHGFGVSEKKGSAESRTWKESFINWLLTDVYK